MGSVLHPVGERPAAVYWLRRALVLLVPLALIVGLVWLFLPKGPAPLAAAPPTRPASPSAPITTPAQTAAQTPTASASTPSTPVAPTACAAESLSASLAGYGTVKAGGTQPFKLTLTSQADADCLFDAEVGTVELAVSSGADRIWTTDHCAKLLPGKTLTLSKGKPVELGIDWPVKRSAKGCKTTKDVLGAGTYVATATYRNVTLARKVMSVTAK
ncbi:hypothetical protein ATK74_2280 [Propionicimonas paludicola]|uniref:DUF4232 domain-containing protein n=1 Tax=Propionicimonas paludicola TaxID=185243 RepID=A0A2A9CTD3_9ACTN|nr:hypothetical protein [Propionicimonas paludicola]PFG17707.1 hypothetical protein ATK74_2280 [Propionicimonas paludicola]